MSGADGGSFGSASMHVGPGSDSWALCHTYGGASLPSLYVHAGRLSMTVYLSGDTITADHVRFTSELAKAAEAFAAECARIHDAAQATKPRIAAA
jgi:hypothetical protein